MEKIPTLLRKECLSLGLWDVFLAPQKMARVKIEIKV